MINRNDRITTKQQLNVNTAFVDGSQIYGSNKELAKNLRDSQSKYANSQSKYPRNKYLRQNHVITFPVLSLKMADANFVSEKIGFHYVENRRPSVFV